MSGLVEQLQADAMDSSVPVTDLLRKAKTVAVKLRQNELAEWIASEMSGYADIKSVPEYRRLAARVQFLNPVRGWCPVVGGEHVLPYGGSVSEISHLLVGEGDALTSPAPPKMVQKISEDVGFQVDARRLFSKAAMAAILDAVRNTIHDWALRLEQAGVHGEGLSFSANEAAKAQSVVFNIGNIGTATGLGAFGNNNTISSSIGGDVKVMAQKVADLVERAKKVLPISSLSKDDKKAAANQLAELKEEASGSKPSESSLRKGLGALRRIMEKASSDLIAEGIEHAIDSILGV